MKMILMMYLNQSIQQLHQTYKHFLENAHAELLLQS